MITPTYTFTPTRDLGAILGTSCSVTLPTSQSAFEPYRFYLPHFSYSSFSLTLTAAALMDPSLSHLFAVDCLLQFVCHPATVIYLFILAAPCSTWDLSSLTRDRTCVPCIRIAVLTTGDATEVPCQHSLKQGSPTSGI